jgi:[protein-PII] uridylyltransferase
LADSLSEVLSGRSSVETLITRAHKAVPFHIHVQLEFRNDLSEDHTVVHAVAEDIPGLLYLMTTILSRNHLEIHSAKIATWGSKAEDAFYVTRADGSKIPDGDLNALEHALAEDLTEH